MTDYARTTVLAQYADNSSLHGGLAKSYVFNATSPAIPLVTQVSALTTGTVLDFTQFATIQFLVIKNTSTTYPIYARGLVVKATKTFLANKLTFADANPDTIADADSTFLSALYAGPGDRVYVSGATDAGNNGTFSVQSAAAGLLTLFASDVLTPAAPDAGTPTIVCLGRAQLWIPIGGVTVLNNVWPTGDLALYGVGGTAEVEVFAAGT